MATNVLSISATFSVSASAYPVKPLRATPNNSPFLRLPFRKHVVSNSFQQRFTIKEKNTKKQKQLLRIVRSVEEETQIIPEEQQLGEEEVETSSSSPDQPAVSVPVSPSDILTMFFQVPFFFFFFLTIFCFLFFFNYVIIMWKLFVPILVTFFILYDLII